MSYPDRPIEQARPIEERVEVREDGPRRSPMLSPKMPQVAHMCEEIKEALQTQDKIICELRARLQPVLAPLPKSEQDLKEVAVQNALVPVAEGLRDVCRMIKGHNAILGGMIEALEV
jgi:hypothetical protein